MISGICHLCTSNYKAPLSSNFKIRSGWLLIVIMVREFTNGPRERGSIPGRVILKTKKKKMVLDTSLLNTQHYKVWIKGKVEQFRERSGAFPYPMV